MAQSPLFNPLIALLLVLAARDADPGGKLATLSKAVENLQQAVSEIREGVEIFNTRVMPIFIFKSNQVRNFKS